MTGATGATGAGFPPVLPSASFTVYVNKAGSDLTGDGSINNPYLTIPHALATIGGQPTITSRFAVMVGPGNYAESFSLPANVNIIGTIPNGTRITGTVDINDPSWATNQDNRSGFESLTLLNAATYDFTGSPEGKLFFFNVRISNTPTFIADNSINQVVIENCMVFGGTVQTGISLTLANSTLINGGQIIINSSAVSDTSLVAFGGGTDGDIVIDFPDNRSTTVNLFGFGVVLDCQLFKS